MEGFCLANFWSAKKTGTGIYILSHENALPMLILFVRFGRSFAKLLLQENRLFGTSTCDQFYQLLEAGKAVKLMKSWWYKQPEERAFL